MTPFIDLGGHAFELREDRYADGRKCYVAEHPDLPGCVAYAESAPAALAALKEARSAYEASVRRHDAPQAPAAGTFMTASSGAGMLLQLA